LPALGQPRRLSQLIQFSFLSKFWIVSILIAKGQRATSPRRHQSRYRSPTLREEHSSTSAGPFSQNWQKGSAWPSIPLPSLGKGLRVRAKGWANLRRAVLVSSPLKNGSHPRSEASAIAHPSEKPQGPSLAHAPRSRFRCGCR